MNNILTEMASSALDFILDHGREILGILLVATLLVGGHRVMIHLAKAQTNQIILFHQLAAPLNKPVQAP